jgi:hypothetical protein
MTVDFNSINDSHEIFGNIEFKEIDSEADNLLLSLYIADKVNIDSIEAVVVSALMRHFPGFLTAGIQSLKASKLERINPNSIIRLIANFEAAIVEIFKDVVGCTLIFDFDSQWEYVSCVELERQIIVVVLERND